MQRGIKQIFRSSLALLLFALLTISAWSCKSDEDENPPSSVQENCSDGEDNDGDGAVDCADLDCLNASSCQEVCNDGIDNDNDGFVDCEDGDCSDFEDCQFERCIDGVDNDGDGLIDCEDPDCDTNPNCT